MNDATNLLPVPTAALDMAPFWAQFYNVMNLFQKPLFAVIGLGFAVIVIGMVQKRFFGGGDG